MTFVSDRFSDDHVRDPDPLHEQLAGLPADGLRAPYPAAPPPRGPDRLGAARPG